MTTAELISQHKKSYSIPADTQSLIALHRKESGVQENIAQPEQPRSEWLGFRKPIEAGVETATSALSKMDEAARANKAGEISYPKRLLRSGAGAIDLIVGTPASMAMETVSQFAKPVTNLIPKSVKQNIGSSISSSIPDDLKEKWNSMSESQKSDIMDALNIVTTIPAVKVGKQLIKTAQEAAPKLVKQEIKKEVPKLIESKAEIDGIKVGNKIVKDIPDIEQIEKAIPEKKIQGLTPAETVKAVKKEAQQNISGKPPVFSRLEPNEANMLSEPKGARDTDFINYATQARKSKANIREMTPMDLSGIKAKKALDEISEMRSEVGKKKSALVENNALKTIPTGDIETKWKKLLNERLGTAIDADGNIIDATNFENTPGTRFMRKPSESGLIKDINSQIKKLGQTSTIKQADDIKSAIYDLVDNSKANMARPINTVTEAIGKEIRKMIDDRISLAVGKRFNKLNTNYARLKNIETQLSKRLGEVTDQTTGQTRMGASLMKSSVMSNSDRGSKALFDAVKKVTGIDLIKEASFAKIAMDAVGDYRASDLLRSMAETKGLVKDLAESQGLFSAVSKVGVKGYEKLRGDKLDELIRFYTKRHGANK